MLRPQKFIILSWVDRILAAVHPVIKIKTNGKKDYPITILLDGRIYIVRQIHYQIFLMTIDILLLLCRYIIFKTIIVCDISSAAELYTIAEIIMQAISQQSEQSDSLIKIYFRNSKRQAKLVAVPTPIIPEDLLTIAANFFHLPQQEIALFHNGLRIDNQNQPLILAERSIVHIVDKRAIDLPEIIVSFRPLWNAPSHKLALTPDLRIRDIIRDFLVPRYDLSPQRFFLVYLGRVLSPAKELRNQMIEDGCQVLLIMHKNYVQKMAIQRDSSQRKVTFQQSIGTTQPITYKTSLQALKKKVQQPSSIHQEESIQIGEPKVSPLDKKNSINDSLNPGPLQKSAMLSQKSSDKRSSEKVGAAPEIEKAAPSSKIESYGSSGSRGGASAEGPEITIKVFGSSDKKKSNKHSDKILGLQSNNQTAPPQVIKDKFHSLQELDQESKIQKQSD